MSIFTPSSKSYMSQVCPIDYCQTSWGGIIELIINLLIYYELFITSCLNSLTYNSLTRNKKINE